MRNATRPFRRNRQPASGAFLRGIWPFPGGHKSVFVLDALRSDRLDALARRRSGKASIHELRSPAGYGGVRWARFDFASRRRGINKFWVFSLAAVNGHMRVKR